MPRFLLTILLSVLAGLALAWVSPVQALDDTRGKDARAMAAITTAELPREGRETLALIRKGGPFPYAKDGTIFSNRERSLPKQPRGFYHEYTVKTPGSRDRGARRIVCGGKQQQVCYYTGDHYASFKIIKE